MKKLLLLTLIAICSKLSAAEYGQLTHISGNDAPTIILNDGDVLEVLSISMTSGSEDQTVIEIITNGGDILTHATLRTDYWNKPQLYPDKLGKVVGGCTVRLRNQSQSVFHLSYKLTEPPR
jgi:hypothetical protein